MPFPAFEPSPDELVVEVLHSAVWVGTGRLKTGHDDTSETEWTSYSHPYKQPRYTITAAHSLRNEGAVG